MAETTCKRCKSVFEYVGQRPYLCSSCHSTYTCCSSCNDIFEHGGAKNMCCKKCKAAYMRGYWDGKQEKRLSYQRQYRAEHLARCHELSKKRYDTYPKESIDARMSAGMFHSLKLRKNGHHWESLVDYSLEDLMTHLESQFAEEMSWENRGKWHIDHIRPLVSFSYESPDDPEFKECWSLKNLQPLWAEENMRKHSRLDWTANKR